jgi:hypothetical protein
VLDEVDDVDELVELIEDEELLCGDVFFSHSIISKRACSARCFK